MQADQLKINANPVQALCFGVTSGRDFSGRWFVNGRTKSISNIDIITNLEAGGGEYPSQLMNNIEDLKLSQN